jgi:hypothetical protein
VTVAIDRGRTAAAPTTAAALPGSRVILDQACAGVKNSTRAACRFRNPDRSAGPLPSGHTRVCRPDRMSIAPMTSDESDRLTRRSRTPATDPVQVRVQIQVLGMELHLSTV